MLAVNCALDTRLMPQIIPPKRWHVIVSKISRPMVRYPTHRLHNLVFIKHPRNKIMQPPNEYVGNKINSKYKTKSHPTYTKVKQHKESVDSTASQGTVIEITKSIFMHEYKSTVTGEPCKTWLK